MDQHLRRRGPNLPPLHPLRRLDIPLAHLPPHHHPLPPLQPLLGRRPIYPSHGRQQPPGIPVLRLPRRGGWRPLTRSGVLGALD